MEMIDFPLGIILFMPLAILFLESIVYGLKIWIEHITQFKDK